MDTSTLIPPVSAGVPILPASVPAPLDTESLVLSATIELLTQLETCDSLEHASTVLRERLCELTGARDVLVGSCGQRSQACRLISPSNSDGVPLTDESQRLADYALDELLIRGKITEIDPTSGEHRQLATGHFAAAIGATRMVGAPLRDGNDVVIGAWLFIDPPAESHLPSYANVVDALSQPIGARLASIALNQPTRLDHIIRSARTIVQTRRTTAAVAALLATICVVMFPIRFPVGCDCKLQPMSRRFVAAPFDGQLQESLVQPGDIVVRGQVLARMNARELQWELAGLDAELSRASKQRSVSLADQEYSDSQIAQLETERLAARRELIAKRIEHLEIRSPIAGVVVSGDIREAVGSPVETGQSLLEIAPLGQMIAELAVPEEYFAYVREGMPVNLRLRAFPADPIAGIVQRIHPRAEIIDGANVFVAEMLAADPHGIYRPGMEGRASIRSERRPLLWVLLHKPWNALRMWWS